MAKKIPVPAVLSFWSIKGIAIPLSSHAKRFVLNRANAYFSKRSDFSHHLKSLSTAKEHWLTFVKNTNANYPTATQVRKCFNY